MDALINCNIRIQKLEFLIDKLISKNIYQQRQIENQQAQIDQLRKPFIPNGQIKQPKMIDKPTNAKAYSTGKVLCTFCSSNHRDEDCSFSTLLKWQAIKRLNHCPKCLISKKHDTLNLCKAPRCSKCTGNHHQLLCIKIDQKKLTPPTETNTISSSTESNHTELDNIPLPSSKPTLQVEEALKLIDKFSSMPDLLTPLDSPSSVSSTSAQSEGKFKIPKTPPLQSRKRKVQAESHPSNNSTSPKKPKKESKTTIDLVKLFGDFSDSD